MLGIAVDVLKKEEVLDIIVSWLAEKNQKKVRQVVTAYSEYFVVSQADSEFARVIKAADLVTADGVSVLAAVKYSRENVGGVGKGLLAGLKVGVDILAGRVGEPVTGVWLFEELCRMAGKRRWRAFLLGGREGVAEQATRIALKRFPGIIAGYDMGERRIGTDKREDGRVIDKINRFKPDLLFVAFNAIEQNKWIARRKDVLKAKVAIGVGGTFDEFSGRLAKPPVWMGRHGLKWLWRLILEPKRLGRIWRAVVVFPWLVFRDSLR